MKSLTRLAAHETSHLAELAADEQTLLTVTFRIGPQQYGLPVNAVVEIVRLPALVTLAGAPPALIGLVNLRGHYIPVLDGSILMDEDPYYDLSNQIVIAGHIRDNRLVPMLGLRVDQVIDVTTLHMSNFTPISTTMAAPFLQGVVTSDDLSILMFNLDALIAMVPEHIDRQPVMAENEPGARGI